MAGWQGAYQQDNNDFNYHAVSNNYSTFFAVFCVNIAPGRIKTDEQRAKGGQQQRRSSNGVRKLEGDSWTTAMSNVHKFMTLLPTKG